MSLRRDERIFLAGHLGMVGRAIECALREAGYQQIVTRSRAELDLCDQQAVRQLFRDERIDRVIVAAARVGGIQANSTRPAEFIRDNLAIELNLIHEAWQAGIGELLFLGSSCIYPRLAPQPIVEEALLSGPLEPTNAPYAIAKIAGIALCEAYNRQYGTRYLALMPTNLYGPHDNFDLNGAHVIPALLRKFSAATLAGDPVVTVWGSGTPRREFLHVDDLARAALFVMENAERVERLLPPGIAHLNVGSGADLSIAELADLIADITRYGGQIRFDREQPDGTPRKLLDIGRLRSLGWQPSIALADGLRSTHHWYLQNIDSARH